MKNDNSALPEILGTAIAIVIMLCFFHWPTSLFFCAIAIYMCYQKIKKNKEQAAKKEEEAKPQ